MATRALNEDMTTAKLVRGKENMAEEVKNGTAPEPERTFTQSELNAILGDRLAQERKKYADYEELKGKAEKYAEIENASKSALQREQEKSATLQKQLEALQNADKVRKLKEKISQETGVPITVLRGDSEEDLRSQAQEILKIYSPEKKSYPQVRDGGEAHRLKGASTAEQFADWFTTSLNGGK